MNFKTENIFLITLIIILSLLSLYIIKSFVLSLVFALMLVYISNPMYKKLLKGVKYHFIAAIIMIILFILVIVIPLGFSMVNLSKDLDSLNDYKIKLFFDDLNTKLNTNINFFEMYSSQVLQVKKSTNDFMMNIPQIIMQIFVIGFAYYYFSKYYNGEVAYLKRIFSSKKYLIISKKLEKLLDGIIYGQIFVRFVQAFLAMIGFLILGIDGAIFLGLLTFFAAFLPIIGTAFIWVPLGFSFILLGNYVTAMQIFGIGIFISVIDNILMPYVISDKTNIGPIVTLISIMGGMEVFGIYGIIIGPFILGLLFVLIDELFYEFRSQNPEFKRYIWSEKERKEFKSIKTEKDREEFIAKIDEKYKLEENKFLV